MLDKYEKAGKIAARVRNKAAKKITAGMKVIDLVNWVESEIKSNGAGLSFPCNISINQIAAHYTSPLDDNTLFCEGDIVKIDLGAEVDGYVSDTAVTVVVEGDNVEPIDEFGNPLYMPGRLDEGNPIVSEEDIEKRLDIIDSSSAALDNVICVIKDGVSVNDIGEIVQDTIKEKGFSPIYNLSGHSLEQYKLHAGVSIPNFPDNGNYILKEGDHIAVEPFATDGVGFVNDIQQHHIYSYLRTRPLRQEDSTRLLKIIRDDFTYFPFAERHLLDVFDGAKLGEAMEPLISSRSIFPYKVIKEKNGGMVAQTEHTIIVEKEGCKITTL